MLAWLGLAAFVAIAVALDLRAGGAAAPPLRTALWWSLAWTAIGVAFAAVLLVAGDGGAAGEYLTGFLIEKSLSLDNLFVFAVLFAFFGVPDGQRRRVLIYGIVGAIVLRGAFIVAGAAVLDAFHAATYLLGALLAVTAIKIARHGGEEVDPQHTLAMRLLRRVLPLSQRFDGGRLTTVEAGRRVATPLLAALLMIAAFDVMFAIDSIPAIFAITRDTYVVAAANAFSLLGMVSLYFLLDGLLERFRHLTLALAAILGYVAAKLVLVDLWHPPIALSLVVVAGALAVAALTSLAADRRDRRASAARPPRASPEPARSGVR